MNQPTSDRQSQEQNSLIKDTNVGGDLIFAPVQVDTQTNIFYGDDPEEEKVSATLNTISPYLGLAPFTASNSKVFYGRKNLINSLSKELEKDCLIFLLGGFG